MKKKKQNKRQHDRHNIIQSKYLKLAPKSNWHSISYIKARVTHYRSQPTYLHMWVSRLVPKHLGKEVELPVKGRLYVLRLPEAVLLPWQTRNRVNELVIKNILFRYYFFWWSNLVCYRCSNCYKSTGTAQMPKMWFLHLLKTISKV